MVPIVFGMMLVGDMHCIILMHGMRWHAMAYVAYFRRLQVPRGGMIMNRVSLREFCNVVIRI
jgi:hypothetical protein